MLTPNGFSDLPEVTPTMAEDLDQCDLTRWRMEYNSDLQKVVMLTDLLALDRNADIVRLTNSLALLQAECIARRDTVRMIAMAYGILQGVDQ